MTKTSTDAQIVGSVSFINGDAQQFTDAKEYLDCIRKELPHEATTGFRFRTMLQLEDSEFDLIKFPQRGVCLYKCGNERYLLEVHAPPYKESLFGKAGGR